MAGIPRDIFRQEDVCPSRAVKGPSIIEQDDDGISESAPSFVIKFVDILLPVAEKEDRRTAFQPVNWLTDTYFEINIYNWYVKAMRTAKISLLQLQGSS